jgi:hypothetical protein
VIHYDYKNQGFTRLNITKKHYWLTQYISRQIMPSSGLYFDCIFRSWHTPRVDHNFKSISVRVMTKHSRNVGTTHTHPVATSPNISPVHTSLFVILSSIRVSRKWNFKAWRHSLIFLMGYLHYKSRAHLMWSGKFPDDPCWVAIWNLKK